MRRVAGSVALLGATIGVAAAGAVAGLATHRYVARQERADDPYAGVDLGGLRGAPVTVMTDDGVALHIEVDEPTGPGGPDAGGEGPPLTVVLCHGFALSLDSWCFQRRALAGVARVVSWDVRSHGRSSRGPKEHLSFRRLAQDLLCVLDEVVPSGPVVLVGHSMGGMTVLSLADLHPELFGTRIAGVGLVATSAGDLAEESFGIPGPVGRLVHRTGPALLALAARQAELVERGRRAGGDVAFLLVRKYAFGSPVPASIVDFCAEMLAGTPVDVVAEFTPMFSTYDSSNALEPLEDVPVTVVGAARDTVTPVEHSRRIAASLPGADYTELADAGHMVLIEHPDVVSAALLRLVARVRERLEEAGAA